MPSLVAVIDVQPLAIGKPSADGTPAALAGVHGLNLKRRDAIGLHLLDAPPIGVLLPPNPLLAVGLVVLAPLLLHVRRRGVAAPAEAVGVMALIWVASGSTLESRNSPSCVTHMMSLRLSRSVGERLRAVKTVKTMCYVEQMSSR